MPYGERDPERQVLDPHRARQQTTTIQDRAWICGEHTGDDSAKPDESVQGRQRAGDTRDRAKRHTRINACGKSIALGVPQNCHQGPDAKAKMRDVEQEQAVQWCGEAEQDPLVQQESRRAQPQDKGARRPACGAHHRPHQQRDAYHQDDKRGATQVARAHRGTAQKRRVEQAQGTRACCNGGQGARGQVRQDAGFEYGWTNLVQSCGQGWRVGLG